MPAKTETYTFLKKWSRGDSDGVEALLERHLPWIRNHVRKRLGPVLRQKAETEDFVQNAVIEFLRYGPKILLSSEDHFRALLVRIVENTIRNQNKWFCAQRRRMSRERPIASDTVLCLDPPDSDVPTPSRLAARNEDEAWVRLALEFLDAADRDVIVLRQWERLSFPEIGERMDISADAARMRHNSAIGRLGKIIWKLRYGKLDQVLAESPA